MHETLIEMGFIYNVNYLYDNDIPAWCIENFGPKYYYGMADETKKWATWYLMIYFKNEDDYLLFKLKWL